MQQIIDSQAPQAAQQAEPQISSAAEGVNKYRDLQMKLQHFEELLQSDEATRNQILSDQSLVEKLMAEHEMLVSQANELEFKYKQAFEILNRLILNQAEVAKQNKDEMPITDDNQNEQALVTQLQIDDGQLQLIQHENEFFVELYKLFNSIIGTAGSPRDEVFASINREIPDNLQDFCEYEALKQLLQIKQTQEGLESMTENK